MKTDWLASNTIFYNTKTNQYSENINNVINFNHFDWHPEGLYNYLDFGYSILQQTPIKHIKFLPHSSKISKNENGKIIIQNFDDPAEKYLNKTSNEQDVLHLIQTKIQNWENSTTGEIIIPTSGGFDSRLLNLMIKDKNRIKSFTYGLAQKQDKSFEVTYAKKIAEILNTKHKFIPLQQYHKYINNWYKQYGIATHSHGMYHIEFYNKIIKHTKGQNPFLSGIFGDVWAGKVNTKTLTNYNHLKYIGYTHNMNANINQLQIKPKLELRKHFFSSNKNKINTPFYQIINTIRFKIILINYLIKIPKLLNFKPYAPFLDIDIALGMLTISEDRKKNRIWQRDFFDEHNLNIENLNLKGSRQNSLNFITNLKVPLKPLSEKILSEIIKPEYVIWINNNLTYNYKNFYKTLLKIIGNNKHAYKISKMVFFKNFNVAYSAYLTLYPLQKIIEQRNEYFRK